MEAGEYDFTVESGDQLPIIVVLKDGDDEVIDLSGCSSEVVINWDCGSLNLTSPDDLTITDAEGKIEGELSIAQVNALPVGRIASYRWSYTPSGGDHKTFLKGYIVRT